MITAGGKVRFNHIKRKLSRVKAVTDEAVDRGASVILAEAQRRVPRGKTLAIAKGLEIRVLRQATDEHAKTVAVGVWGVKESKFQENGTRFVHAQPYLRPGSLLGRRTLKQEATALISHELNAS